MIQMAKSTIVEAEDQEVYTPTTKAAAVPQASVTYHPGLALAIQQEIKMHEDAIVRLNAALTQNPPLAPVAPVVSTDVLHGTVASDFAEVYQTPHTNAKVIGTVATGGILPLQADASKDTGFTWWKIAAGEFKGGYVKGRGINMQ
jgi:hypothetical protein